MENVAPITALTAHLVEYYQTNMNNFSQRWGNLTGKGLQVMYIAERKMLNSLNSMMAFVVLIMGHLVPAAITYLLINLQT